jgi:LmbE family N-acetylglucosaminyl deacetylase
MNNRRILMEKMKNRNLYRFFEYIRSFLNYSIPVEKKLPASKILLIAPIQGDEAIGCSGVLSANAHKKGSLEIIYCTKDTPERMKEAEKAASLLGSKRNHFLQFPEKHLTDNKDFCENLIKLFNNIKPAVVFLPFWFDNHPTHIALSKALLRIRKKIELEFVVYAYGVWTPIIPNCVFDITDEWESKKKVLECYKSQDQKNHIRMVEGINQYWASMKVPDGKYAEAFFTISAAKYISLGRKIFK